MRAMANHQDNTGLTQQALALLQAGQLKEAELRFRESLSRDPLDAQALHGLGIVAHHTGNFDAAIDLFDRALALAPRFAAAWVNRGNSLSTQQNYAAGCAVFT